MRDHRSAEDAGEAASQGGAGSPGRSTLTEGLVRRAAEGPLPESARAPMESAFAESFADVKVHTDSPRATGGTQALTEGSDVHFARGLYQPESPDGSWLLAHELAHVVQQRGAAPTAQAFAPGEERGLLEADADRAADQAVTGQPARVAMSAPRGMGQAFAEEEHKYLGDEGSKGTDGKTQYVKLADNFPYVAYGDIVACGDYFESTAQMQKLANTPGTGKGTREEVLYVIFHQIQGKPTHNISEAAKKAADERFYALAAGNVDHFPNPRAGDTAKPEADLRGRKNARGAPETAGGTYAENHTSALAEAVRAGQAGEKIDQALLLDAFGNHFLTDAFSSGHMRTPRVNISEYWNAKVPLFWTNFTWYSAEKIAEHVHVPMSEGVLVAAGGAAARKSDKADMAKSGFQTQMKELGIPAMGFGNLVGLSVHDYDNKKGVSALDADGQAVTFVGDSQLPMGLSKDEIAKQHRNPMGRFTQERAIAAVKVSVAEVRKAYDEGKAGKDAASVSAAMLTQTGIYSAEAMMPQVLPDDDKQQKHKSLKWDYDDWRSLLLDPDMQEAIRIMAVAKAGTLAGVGDSMQPKFKGDAFKAGVVDNMKKDPIAFVTAVIEYAPNAGGGLVTSQDGAASGYLEDARKVKGGFESLELDQKKQLIKDLINDGQGSTSGGAELCKLFDSLDLSIVIIYLETFGWHKAWKVVAGQRAKFIEKYGTAYWEQQSYADKAHEILIELASFSDGQTLMNETAIMIVRTMTRKEQQQLHDTAKGRLGTYGKWYAQLSDLIHG